MRAIAASVALLHGAKATAQVLVTWDGGGGGGSAWLTGTNWLGVPTDVVPGVNDAAVFNNLGTSTSIGINFSGATNNGTNNQAVGAILLDTGSTVDRMIGSSGSTAGTLTLNGYLISGNTTFLQNNVAGRTLSLAPTISGGTGAMRVALNAANGSIDVASGATISISSIISETAGGAKGFTKAGAGTLVLSGANTFAGGVTLSAGTLVLGADSTGSPTVTAGPVGTGALVVNGGTLFGTVSTRSIGNNVTVGGDFGIASLTLAGPIALGGGVRTISVPTAGTGTFSGLVSGSAGNGLTKAGAGILRLTNAGNTFDGAVTVNAGTVIVATLAVPGLAQPLGQGTGAVTLGSAGAAGALSYTGSSVTWARPIDVGGAGGGVIETTSPNTLTLTGGIGGTGPFTFAGSGSFTVSTVGLGASVTNLTKANTGTLTLNAPNGFAGDFIIAGGGSVILNGANTLPSTANLTFVNTGGAATLSLNTAETYSVAGLLYPPQAATTAGTTINFGNAAAVLALSGGIDYNPFYGSFGSSPLTVGSAGTPGELALGTAIRSFNVGTHNNATGDVQINAKITAGAGGGINKSGTGILRLASGESTFPGGLTLGAGVLRLDTASTGAAGAVTKGPVGTGVLALNAGTILSTAVSGISVNNDVTLGGNIATESITFGGAIDLGTSVRQVFVPSARTGTFSGVIAGSGGGMTKTGTGTLVISNAGNSYTGATTLSDGTLALGGDNVLGTGVLNLNAGTIASTGTAVRTVNNSVTVGGNIGLASISFTGSSFDLGAASRTVTLVGNASSTIAAPIAAISGSGMLVTVSGSSGALAISGSNTGNNGTLTVERGTVIAPVGSLPLGNVTVGNALTTSSPPALLLSSGALSRSLGSASGSFQFGGPTASTQGIAAAGADLTINFGGAGAPVTWGAGGFVNGTLALGSTLATHKVELQNPISLGTTGSGTRRVLVENNPSTPDDRATLSGKISGISGFTFAKEGTGVLVLSHPGNDYAGPTAVNGGTLVVSGAITGSGPVTVGTSAQLATGASPLNGSIAAAVTVSSTGQLAPGEVGSVGSMSLSSSLTLASGSTTNLFFDISSVSVLDQILVTGALALSGTSATINVAGTLAAGQTFTLLTYGSRTGGLFTLGSMPNGFGGTLTTGATSTTLFVTLAPRNLTWDSNGATAPGGLDGGGTWDLSNQNWFDGTGNVTFDPARPDNAVIGNGGTGGVITLGSDVTLGNLTFAPVAATPYTVTAASSEKLTVVGTIIANESATLAAGMDLASSQTWQVASGKTLTVSGAVGESGGTRALTKDGAGQLTLSGNNLFAGGLTVSNGTVQVSSGANLGAGNGGVNVNFGALRLDGDFTVGSSRTVSLGGGSIDVPTARTAEIASVLAGSGILSKVGAGTLVLSNPTNTHAAVTNLYSGALRVGADEVLSNAHGVQFQSAGTVLDVNGRRETVGSVASSGGLGEVRLGGGTLSVTAGSTYTGTITGTGGAFRVAPALPTDAPAVNLEGNSTYTGSLVVGNPFPTPTDGGSSRSTLVLRGASGQVSGVSDVTINNSSVLNFNQNSGGVLTGRVNPSAAINSNSGRISYTSPGSGGAISDTLPSLNGTGLTSITQTATSLVQTTLNFGAFTPGTDRGTLWFRAGGAGSFGATATNRTTAFFSGGLPTRAASGTPTGTATALVPFAASVHSGTGTDPQGAVTYDATNGVQTLAWTNSAFFRQVASGSLFANDNNNVTATITQSTPVTINSLAFSTTATISGTSTITNFSGYVGNFNTVNLSGPTLSFSSTGFFHLGFPFNIQGSSRLLGSDGIVVSSLGTSSSYLLDFAGSSPSSAASPFTGGLFINGNATVRFNNLNQVGDLADSSAGFTLGGGSLNYSGTAAASVNAARSLRVTAANGTIVIGAASGTLTINGQLTGSGMLNKSGTGPLVLNPPASPASTFSGPINVTAGRLQVDSTLGASAGSVSVAATATLSGSGDLNGRLVVVSTNGTLEPGSGIGTLRTGSLHLLNGALLRIEIDNDVSGGTAADQVDVVGSATLGVGASFPTLQFVFTPVVVGTLTPNQTFVIIRNDGADPVTGIFGGVPDGVTITSGLLSYFVDYQYDGATSTPDAGNDVAVTFLSVPEPATGAGAAALLVLMARRRRQGQNAVS